MTVEAQYVPQGRIERLIATGRVVLATSSLLAIWLDPSQPTEHAASTYALLVAYVTYAAGLALFVWSVGVPRFLFRVLTHVLDLLLFSLIIFLTEGPPTSPFFVYFTFSILCATLRWGQRATLWTAGFSLAVFLGMGLGVGGVLDDERLNRFIIHSVYLSVVATMLGYVVAHEQRLRGEISKLAAWPRRVPRDAQDVVREALEYAAEVVEAPRIVMVWEEAEEPWVHVARWSLGGLTWDREAPGTMDPLVAVPLTAHTFLCLDAADAVPTVLYRVGATALQSWRGTPLHTHLHARLAVRTVLAAPLSGEALHGRLFFLDKPRMTPDDLVLGDIVAQKVAARLEHFYLLQELQRTAVIEERVSLARDLHDGLLQSLTATSLQLHTLRRTLGERPPATVERFEELQRLITGEQRKLRSFIRELKPAALLPYRRDTALVLSLRNVTEQIERHWGLRADLTVGELEPGVVELLGYHISMIVHEALVNAARHGTASSARIEIEGRDDQVAITVVDNGRGFSFRGRYDLPTLTRMNAGPQSLRERIVSLGGTLDIESRDAGARLEIRLPVVRRIAQKENGS